MSEEFIAPSPAGEDKIIIDDNGVARKLEDFQGEVDEQRIQNGIKSVISLSLAPDILQQ